MVSYSSARCYEFDHIKENKLPQSMFQSDKWSIACLQAKKNMLNQTKGLLSGFDLSEWSNYTKGRDPSGFIKDKIKAFAPEMLSQSWCKMYEMLCTFELVQRIKFVEELHTWHLCEGPGAFVTALNHYLVTNNPVVKWHWRAVTLNPYYEGNSRIEMLPDDRFVRHTLEHWCFGVEFNGDIRAYANHCDIVSEAKKAPGKINLVTADGSCNCMDNPGEQERTVEFLIYCEICTALQLLAEGGNFIVKIFTIFEDTTICLIYLLTVLFHEVSVCKPMSSKSGNSEMYIICLSYKGGFVESDLWPKFIKPYQQGEFPSNSSMFNLNDLNEDFLEQITFCAESFMRSQIEFIEENIKYFRQSLSNIENQRMRKRKSRVAKTFMQRCKIKRLLPTNKLAVAEYCCMPQKEPKPFSINYVLKFDVRFDVICSTDNQYAGLSLNVVYGRPFEVIKSSRFCSRESLISFNQKRTAIEQTQTFGLKNSKTRQTLYDELYNRFQWNIAIINGWNFKHFSWSDIYFCYIKEIQRAIAESKDILILRCPLLTHVIVAITYLAIFCYSNIQLYNNGSIFIHKIIGNIDCVKHILCMLSEIPRPLQETNQQLLQIVTPMIFDQKTFRNIVYTYNEIVMRHE